MTKRILSAILAVVLLISLCPAEAAAAENGSQSFGTLEEVAKDIRGYMTSRTEQFTVYLDYAPSGSDMSAIQQEIMDAIDQAFDLATVHTGNPTEGDYIRGMWSIMDMSWEGMPSISGGFQIALTFTLDYFSDAAQEAELDVAVEALLDELDLYRKSDYEKIRGIYDYICRNVSYDYDNLNDNSNTLKHTAYAALIQGAATCQGFSTLFYRLALELGVDTRLVTGTCRGQTHAWNIVEVDGLYYNADATWDSHMAADGLPWQCFLMSDAGMTNHSRDEAYNTDEFHAEYPMASTNYTPDTDPGPTEPVPTEPVPTEHSHRYQALVTQPTCTEQGYTTYTCACGDRYTDRYTDPLGHSYQDGLCSRCGKADPEYQVHVHTEEVRNAKDATCTSPGYSGDVYCAECGELIRNGTTIASLGHSYGKWVIEKYPSGGSDGGTKARYCTECGSGEFSHIGVVEEDHPNGFPVNVTCGPGGSCAQAIRKADPGHEVVLDVFPNQGFTLADIICTSDQGVKVDPPRIYGDRNQYIVITMPEGPLNIQLVFEEKAEHRINIITTGEGSVTADLETAWEGQEFTFQCTPAEGYDLVFVEIISHGTYDPSWTSLGNDRFSVTMPDGDIDILVTFDRLGGFPVSVSTSPGGTASLSPDHAHEGDRITLTVQPDPGYQIDQVYVYSDGTYVPEGWQTGPNTFEIVMPDGGIEIYVTFLLADNPFTDVKESDYFYRPVLWAVTDGITSGMSETRFGPGNPCTRAQVVTFLWRAAGSPEPRGWYNPFTDVKETDYFYKAVLWAVENGITAGMSETRFGSNHVCTRAQVVTFLWRACGSPEPQSWYNPFTDVKDTDYFYIPVLFAVEYGITSGMSETRFGSANTCTRAHVVTFLYKTVRG